MKIRQRITSFIRKIADKIDRVSTVTVIIGSDETYWEFDIKGHKTTALTGPILVTGTRKLARIINDIQAQGCLTYKRGLERYPSWNVMKPYFRADMIISFAYRGSIVTLTIQPTPESKLGERK